MQLFSGVTSVPNEAIVLGIVPEALYVPVQVDAVGSIMQFFIVVTSLSSVVHTEPSHFEVRTFGSVVAPLYVVVHAADVGSVMQSLISVTDFGRLTDALYAVVHAYVVGSSMQLFNEVKSVLRAAIAFGIVPAEL